MSVHTEYPTLAMTLEPHSYLWVVQLPRLKPAPMVRKQLLLISPRFTPGVTLTGCERTNWHDQDRAKACGSLYHGHV